MFVWQGATPGMVTGKTLTFTVTGRLGGLCADQDVSNGVNMKAVEATCGVSLTAQSAPVSFHAGAGLTAPEASLGLAWINLASADQTPPLVGATIRYTITLQNTAAATAYNVMVCDTLPTDLATVFSMSAPAGWVVDATRSGTGGKLLAVMTKSSLAPGESAEFQVKVVPFASGNLASAVAASFSGPCPGFLTKGPVSATIAVSSGKIDASAARLARVQPGKILLGPNVIAPGGTGTINLAMRGSAGGRVEVSIYDEGDRLVRRFNVTLDAHGLVDYPYDGRDLNNSRLAPGSYWIRADGGGVNDRRPFMVVPRRRR